MKGENLIDDNVFATTTGDSTERQHHSDDEVATKGSDEFEEEFLDEAFEESAEEVSESKTPKSVGVLACEFCGLVFEKRRAMRAHLLSHTGDEQPTFPCDVCGRRYRSRDNLKSHQRIHTDAEFVCSQCGASFKYFGSYSYHKKSVQ